MSLQDKVKKIVPHFVTSNSDNYYAIRDKITDESATEYINKILDTAVEACKDTMVYDEYDPSRTFIESINKLRGKS